MKIIYDPDSKLFNFEEITPAEFRAIRRFMNKGKFLEDLEQDRAPKKLEQEVITGADLAKQIDSVRIPGF